MKYDLSKSSELTDFKFKKNYLIENKKRLN